MSRIYVSWPLPNITGVKYRNEDWEKLTEGNEYLYWSGTQWMFYNHKGDCEKASGCLAYDKNKWYVVEGEWIEC